MIKKEYGKPKLFRGLAVEVEIPEGKFAGHYFSRVRRFSSKSVELDAPSVGGIQLPLRDDQGVIVRYAEQRTSCLFSGKIKVGRDDDGNVICTLRLPARVEKCQLREYARVKTVESVRYKPIPSPEILRRARSMEDVPSVAAAGHFVDISGAGAKVLGRAAVAVGDEVMLSFTLPIVEAEFPALVGQVIKADPTDKGCVFVVKWIVITEPERQDLIQFVFQKQIRTRSRGL